MYVYKPLRAVLFSYELLRFLFLIFSLTFFSSLQAVVKGELFPYLVYISSNALFLLICFFLFLNPKEYRNYLPLYMAGKVIAVVLFFIWAFFSFYPETGLIQSRFLGRESLIEGMILLGGVFIISLGDTLSIFGTWILNRKLPQADNLRKEENGGNGCE